MEGVVEGNNGGGGGMESWEKWWDGGMEEGMGWRRWRDRRMKG